MSRISVQVEDLRRAIQQCEQLRQRLLQQVATVKGISARLQEWKGKSAEELRMKMERFVQGANAKISELEQRIRELEAYISRMLEADRSLGWG
ncbi:Archaeal/vacuolar-type H+-ATPase subunit I [Paenibacillus uliginis N3/975]|uniref:Archaeal/vacuolar-type H+-ATPase subunit I n=1 Tax=Paenibacillus uliginis N3/975 TaxID=1313296 RepID=A0A1X7HTA8_9BACL|nr:WXG100 family type VII secretion target [Paenibacillus uliginis]SMF91530.1 Archaeal/vacuolar-type H+-ATPase subunit I [Paenibacillus uliginis N3/975]